MHYAFMSIGYESNQIPSGPGVVDVNGGCRAYPALAGFLADELTKMHEPEKALLVGLEGDRGDFLKALVAAGYDASLGRVVVGDSKETPEYGEVEFSLASLKNAKAVVRACQEEDGPSIVVLLFQELHEEYLDMVLEECPNVCVYSVGMSDPSDLRVKFEKRKPAGAPGPSIPNIPADAMYGRAWEWARSLDSPMGFAYPAVLATACGFGIEASGGVRPALYAALLGDVGAGKSVAKNRAGQLFFGSNPDDRGQAAIDERFVVKVPASDRGLYNILAGAEGKPRLLALDELRNMMGKGSIDGSTLMSLLCELWNANNAGVADRKGAVGVNAKLSMVGCLKVSNPAEFRKVFDYSSAHGFYDRCVFGIEPENSWAWRHAEVRKADFSPSAPSVSPDVYEAVHSWKKSEAGRGRLGEIVLRVAYVAAAVNRDPHVSEKALYAALKFGEWQERIRRYFQPAEGADSTDQLVSEVERAFAALPGHEGNWRELSRAGHWHKNFGRVIKPVKAMLVEQGMLIPCKKRGWFRYYVENKEKRS